MAEGIPAIGLWSSKGSHTGDTTVRIEMLARDARAAEVVAEREIRRVVDVLKFLLRKVHLERKV
jgi:hypothetical protein